MAYVHENLSGRISISNDRREGITLTPDEVDDLITKLSRIRHKQRNDVTARVYELYVHHDGEIVPAGYYATLTRNGDGVELLRTKKRESKSSSLHTLNALYGKTVATLAGFASICADPDTVSYAIAEREQLLYLGRKLAAERGMTLKQMLDGYRKEQKDG